MAPDHPTAGGGRRDLVLGGALALGSAAVVLWQSSRLAVLWDLSYVLENATRIAAGDVPYRDFPFPYAPLTFLGQAAIIRLLGRHYALHVAYAALAAAVATALTYVLVRRLGCRPAVAVVLCAPLVVLGIYCIFPHPFYDPDACLAVLVALLPLVRAGSPRARFLGGMAAVVPLFVKQNIGLPFLATVGLVLLLRRDGWGLGGIAAGLGGALGALAATAGLGSYVRWTMRFAAERRLPAAHDYFGIWDDRTLWWWLAVTVPLAGAAVLAPSWRPSPSWRRWSLGQRWPSWPGWRRWSPDARATALLTAATLPWIWAAVDVFVTGDPLAREEALLRFWPLVLVAVWVRRPTGLSLAALAAILGAFLSQQTWGSTYGIWPLLVLLLAFLFRDALLPALVVSSVLLLHGVPYVVANQRLTYAKVEEGPLARAALPPLRGLAMHGPWLGDFAELVAWTDQHVPREDAILCLPGEDLFYFTTGRRPRLPVLLFDRTINPYDAATIAGFPARWMVVKRRLQLDGTPFPELPEVLRRARPTLVARLRNYDVYRR